MRWTSVMIIFSSSFEWRLFESSIFHEAHTKHLNLKRCDPFYRCLLSMMFVVLSRGFQFLSPNARPVMLMFVSELSAFGGSESDSVRPGSEGGGAAVWETGAWQPGRVLGGESCQAPAGKSRRLQSEGQCAHHISLSENTCCPLSSQFSLSLLQEKLLSTRGQNGSNQLYELLQSELQLRPDDTYINHKLVRLYSADGRHEEALKHCLVVEKTGLLRDRLEWYELLVSTLQVSDRPALSVSAYVRKRFLHHQIMKNHLTDSYMDCFWDCLSKTFAQTRMFCVLYVFMWPWKVSADEGKLVMWLCRECDQSAVFQEYLCQPSVASNEQASRKLHKELLLALCSRVRLTLTVKSCEESADALWRYVNTSLSGHSASHWHSTAHIKEISHQDFTNWMCLAENLISLMSL